MSNYTVATNFGAKDALPSGNPAKLILGAQLTTEFNNIATAIATKLDSGGAGSFTTLTSSGAATFTAGAAVSGGVFSSRGITDNATATALTIAAGGLVTLGAGLTVNGAAFTSRGIADNATSNALTIDSSGNVTVPNGTGSLSPVYAGVPQNLQSSSYVLVITDANKHIHHGSASPHTFTIPANASVAFPVGTAVTFTNGSAGGVITLAITTDTLQWAPSGATGSRTMTGASVATALKVSSNVWILTGTGIT